MTTPTWRKSSGCHHIGTCEELEWRTATASCSNNCVQVASAGHIAVRDSKNPDRPHLHFTKGAFAAFTHALRTPA